MGGVLDQGVNHYGGGGVILDQNGISRNHKSGKVQLV